MLNIYFYKLFNPDIQHLNNNQLLYHWNTIGKNEDRINSLDSFFNKYKRMFGLLFSRSFRTNTLYSR
jgi:hypothetical protein